jgi:hypothetical protein
MAQSISIKSSVEIKGTVKQLMPGNTR